jgi:hypothetical protein
LSRNGPVNRHHHDSANYRKDNAAEVEAGNIPTEEDATQETTNQRANDTQKHIGQQATPTTAHKHVGNPTG